MNDVPSCRLHASALAMTEYDRSARSLRSNDCQSAWMTRAVLVCERWSADEECSREGISRGCAGSNDRGAQDARCRPPTSRIDDVAITHTAHVEELFASAAGSQRCVLEPHTREDVLNRR